MTEHVEVTIPDLNVNVNLNPYQQSPVQVHVFHHFPDGPVKVTLVPDHKPAVRAALRFGTKEVPMPGKITIDTVNETVTLAFTDRLGEDTTAPDNLGTVSFTSSDPAVATVATDATNPLQGNISPTGAGTVSIGVDALTLADGSPLLEADGTTPFPVPDAQSLEVDPGAATGDRLTLGPQ